MKKSIIYLILIVFLALLFIPSVSASFSDSINSYWRFNNNASDSIGENDGIVNKANNTNGFVGNSYSFPNSDESINIDSLDFSDRSSFTITAWVKPSSISSYSPGHGGSSDNDNAIFEARTSSNDVATIGLGDDDELYGYIDTSSNANEKVSTSSPMKINEWQHITMTWNGTKAILYHNSTKIIDFYVDGTIASGTPVTTLALWRRNQGDDGGNSDYYGKIDEVAFWNNSLNSSEIEILYNRTKNGKYGYLGDYNDIVPLSSNFSTSYGSTNFSKISDLTSVPNMTLAVSNSKVNWKNNVNAKNQNYDKNVKLSQGLVSVNSSALDSSINSSATVNLDVSSCSSFDIYKSDKPVSSLSELKSQGSVVGDESGCSSSYCSNVSCSNGELTYDVQHFSSTGGDSTDSTETVPEFSTYTLLLTVAITILGFYIIRE